MQSTTAKAPRHKDVYSFSTGFPIFSLSWSQRPGIFRLGVGSCIEEYQNKIQILQLPAKGEPLVAVATADHPYPPTKLMWTPAKGAGPELMATSADYLRIWDFRDRDGSIDPSAGSGQCSLTMKSTLANVRRSGGVGFSSCREVQKLGEFRGVEKGFGASFLAANS